MLAGWRLRLGMNVVGRTALNGRVKRAAVCRQVCVKFLCMFKEKFLARLVGFMARFMVEPFADREQSQRGFPLISIFAGVRKAV